MKRFRIVSAVLVLACGLVGCATDSELSQKEKDKLARDAEKESQKQSRAQEKMMRGNTGTGTGIQRNGSR